ncbi:unnamed protein product [Brassica oleracea]
MRELNRNCNWQSIEPFLTASLKQKKLIDMEDHPDEESFELSAILILSPVKELEYLHRDETGDFGSRSPSLDGVYMSHIVTIVYRKRKRKRRYSFFPWKVINGKNTLFNHSCLSIYLDVADANHLPSGWSRYSPFSLAVVNQSNTNYSITRETTQDFSVKSKDWGFESFMNLSDLHDHTLGYLLDDTILVEAELWKVETKTPGECYASCGGCTWGERLRHLRHICSVFQKKTKV